MLFSFARRVLGDRHQQTSAGATFGHALSFEMNALFEQYLARLVTRALAGSRYSVSAQGGHRDCLFEAGTGRFRTKPDLIIRHGDRSVLVVDTKCKRMAPRIDDPKQRISQADVYQLIAHSQLYCCRDVMLLCPDHGESPPPICTRYAIAHEGTEETVHVATRVMTGPSGAHVDALKSLLGRMLTSAVAA